jgi:LCP family protein required for cell wall assembly
VESDQQAASIQATQRSWRVRWLLSLVACCYCAYIGFGFLIGGKLVASGLDKAGSFAIALDKAGSLPDPRQLPPVDAGAIASALLNPADLVAQAPLLLIPDWNGTERINVLLLGLDQRDTERAAGIPTRTDVMIVVSADPVSRTAALISFPRDMWVAIPGLGEQRINEAYPYGQVHRVEGGGPGLAERTIEQNFGVRATHYAVINFQGFEETVNLLGGVAIDVPRPVKDDEYPTENYGVERVFFAPGPQLMDGATALKYARTRHADNDFARNARQRQVLLAIRDRALRFSSLSALPSLIDRGMHAVDTDFTASELLSLAKLASQMDSAGISTLAIQAPLVTGFRGVGGAALLLPQKDAIRKAIEQAISGPRELAAPDSTAPSAGPG